MLRIEAFKDQKASKRPLSSIKLNRLLAVMLVLWITMFDSAHSMMRSEEQCSSAG
jgi:hypothetical protein